MSVMIKQVSFENFRQYGTSAISFDNKDCSLHVLIAKNGTGKTTFQNAITWCLYEKEFLLITGKESLPVLNSEVLNGLSENESVQVSVKILIMDTDKNCQIEFVRTRAFKRKDKIDGTVGTISSPSEYIVSETSMSDGTNTQTYYGNDAILKTKQYFDQEIHEFFFFDGERLSDYFTKDKAETIKKSVDTIAQITMMNNAISHLEKQIREKRKEAGKDVPDLCAITDEIEALDILIKSSEEQRRIHENLRKKAEEELEVVDAALQQEKPIAELLQERKTRESNRDKMDLEMKAFQVERATFIREYIPLLRLYPRIKATLTYINKKEKAGELPPSIDLDLAKQILDNPGCNCPLCNSKTTDATVDWIQGLLERIKVSNETSNYLNKIKGSLEQAEEKARQYPRKRKELTNKEFDIERRIKENSDRLKEISADLACFDEAGINRRVAELERRRIEIRQTIRDEGESVGVCKNNCDRYGEQKKQKEQDREKIELQNKTKNKYQSQLNVYISLCQNMKTVRDTIVARTRSDIEEATWIMFDDMIWKKNTFGFIKLTDSYDLSVFNTQSQVMTGSLSATELMALAYSFTLAIHAASGKNCPLVIDSPLGRVSDENRENMAKSLMKVSSEQEKQIIMLFTPDEYSENVRSLYDGKVNVRTLTLSDDEKFVEGVD